MNRALITEYMERMDGQDVWSRNEELVVREIIRQFITRAVSLGTAHSGVLFQEDKSNPDMSGLLDSDTGEIINTVSSDYINNKYETGVSLYVDIVGMETDIEDVAFPRGVQQTVVLQGITVMCPEIRSGDVWKDSEVDKYYFLKPVKTQAAVKGFPVVAVLQMFELAPSAPEYSL